MISRSGNLQKDGNTDGEQNDISAQPGDSLKTVHNGDVDQMPNGGTDGGLLFCAGDAIVIRQWCFQSGRMFFLSAADMVPENHGGDYTGAPENRKGGYGIPGSLQSIGQHIGGQKHRAGVIGEREKIFRFFPGDFFLSIKLSSQSGSHGITAEKPQKESIHSVSIQPQKMPAEPFKMPQKAGNHPCMDQEIR